MARRQYLVAYDIGDDDRRMAVYKRMLDEGERIQFSVFICECTATERIRLEADLSPMIHHDEDQIILLDLGPNRMHLEKALRCIGKNWNPPGRNQIV